MSFFTASIPTSFLFLPYILLLWSGILLEHDER